MHLGGKICDFVNSLIKWKIFGVFFGGKVVDKALLKYRLSRNARSLKRILITESCLLLDACCIYIEVYEGTCENDAIGE